MDDARVLDLLRGEVAGRVLGEQLGEDEEAVERCPQLVAHVGQELGLVGGGARQLAGSVLQFLPGLFDLQVLGLDVAVLAGEQGRLLLQLRIGALQFHLLDLQFLRTCLELPGQPLGLLQEFVGTGVGDDGVEVDADGLHQLAEEVPVYGGEGREGGELDHPEDLVLHDDGQDDQAARGGVAEPGGDDVAAGDLVGGDDPVAARGLPHKGLPEGESGAFSGAGGAAVGADQDEQGAAGAVLGEVEGPVLGGDERRQFVHDEFRDGGEVPVALHQAGDPGQVGLEPVLLLVGPGALPQRADHGVDVVLEFGDLARGVDGDRAGQVALGDRAGDLGDGPDLAGEVAGELVDVLGQPLPRAGHALDLGLAAEPALAADLAGDAGDLGGEGGELVDHRVDGGLQLQDLPPRIHVDLLGQVAVGDGRRDERDVADLAGEVVRHGVDVVGEVLPGTGDVGNLCLAAEPALGADLAGHPRHLVGERGQRVDHRVDDAGQRGDLALRLHHDLLREVAAGDGGGHLGDGADLARQVGRHHVDVVGEVLPRAGDPAHRGLATQVALGTDLAGHPGHLVGEGGQLVDHRVDGLLQLQDLPPRVHPDLLRQISLGHRGGDLRDRAHLGGQVVGHDVDRLGQVLPGAGHALDVRLAAEPALGTDLPGDPGDLSGEGGQLVDHRVDGLLQLQDLPARGDVDLLREVALGHGRGDLGDGTHLGREVSGHEVDRIREVQPGAADSRYVRLAAERSLGAHLAGHPGHLGREQRQLVGHPVEHGGDLTEQPVRRIGQPGTEVSVPYGRQAGQQLAQFRFADPVLARERR